MTPRTTRPDHDRVFHVVLPLKPLDRAKSRLDAAGDGPRRALVLAFLLDVVDAVLAVDRVGRVVLVTDDPTVPGSLVERFGDRVEVVADLSPSELNAALRHGAAHALGVPTGATRAPDDAGGAGGLLALCADLPALDAAAVDALLDVAPTTGAGFVADLAGTGTTAYLAARLDDFDPRFGPGSGAAHRAQGAVELSDLVPVGLRADVDTLAELRALGTRVGAATRAVLERTRDRTHDGPLLD